MRFILAALTGITMVALAPQVRADDVKDLQGTWKIVGVQVAGRTIPAGKFTLDAIVIKGDRLALSKDGKEAMDVTISVDSSASPKQMIWENPEHGSLPTIFEIKGNRLKLCFPLQQASKDNDIPAPEGFDTKGQQAIMFAAERQ